MNVTYAYNVHPYWARAHRTGCRDIGREYRGADGVYTTEVASHRELIEELAGDFIFYNDEQPWTDYIGEVSLAPCLAELPREVQA